MASSLMDIRSVRVSSGSFSNGAELELFNASKPGKPHRASVVFGRNGSGKTTVANSIFEAVNDPNAPSCFLDGNSNPLAIPKGSSVRVFSEAYIREKVQIESDGLEAIVMLGDQAAAQRRIKDLDAEIVRLGETRLRYQKRKDESESGPKSLEKLEKKAKDCAKDGGWASRLVEVEGGRPSLTAQRWESIRSAETNNTRDELAGEFSLLLEKYKRADAAGSAVDWRIPEVDLGRYDEGKLSALLSEEIDEPRLTEREERLIALTRRGGQGIVEKAREVFASSDTTHCPMCQQGVSSEYKSSLVSSILKILSKEAEEYSDRLDRAALETLRMFPDVPPQVSRDKVDALRSAIGLANAAIEKCNGLIGQRRGNLYTPVPARDLGIEEAITGVNVAIAAINNDIEALNSAVAEKDELKRRLRKLNDEIAWIDARAAIAEHRAVSESLEEAKAELGKISLEHERLSRERSAEEAKIKMTNIAVDSINGYLATIYFDARRFRLVASDGMYKIESNGKPVEPKRISTGERNALALCYFFSESGKNKFKGSEDSDPQYLILDDPISSFDMENRIGICSLLRERIAHILSSNGSSRVTVMTHDAAAVAELEHIFDDIHDELKSTENIQYDLFELRDCATAPYLLKKGRYQVLLKRVYEYATSEDEDDAESIVIGNIIRRVLEGYGSFNYGIGMASLSRDPKLRERFGDLESTLSNAMYRLALNDDSHMDEGVKSLNPSISFERYGYDEKRKLAQYALVILNRFDPEHVGKQLSAMGVDASQIAQNISDWERSLSER